jgi:FAD/FMN-containing dehydrogenase
MTAHRRVSVRRTNAFDALRAAVHGAVLSPEDDGFQSTCSPWNRAVRQRPAVAVRAVRPDDVVTAVRFAGEHGMPIAVQAAGHGARIPADGALLVDTSALTDIEVDPATNVAMIGAGARLSDVVLAAERHGLAMPAGYARTVGAVGYTIGGGHGWFARQHGLATESVRSIDLVTPTGKELHLTADLDPDLWWGMLGYGAALATVTSLEVQLLEIRQLAGGRLTWPIDRTEDVLAAYADAAADLPGEVSLDLALLQQDASDGSRSRSVVVDAVAAAPLETLESITAPLRSIPDLRSDSTTRLRPSDLFAINDDPTDPTPEHYDGGLLDELGAGAVAAIAATFGEGSENPFDSLRIRRLGGALTRQTAGTAVGRVEEPFLIFGVAIGAEDAVGVAVAEATARLRQAVGPTLKPQAIPNFVGTTPQAAATYRAPEPDRLRNLKRRVDPHGLLRFHPPLPLPD